MDWKASGLLGDAHGGGGGGGSGSCVQRTARCLGDQVCNRKLGPLLQACTAGRCNRSRCREAASLFYGGLPPPVADLLGMCECGPGDEQCQHVAAMLHGGTCGEEPPWSCLEGLNHCLGDRSCRQRLRSFVSACWRADSAPCGGADGVNGDCVWLMDPALLLSGEVGCRAAFVALVGTPLRYPCTCAGLNAGERRRCDAVSDVLRNRSRFAGPWQPLGDSYQNIGTAESESEDQALVTGHLLYGLIYMALVVIVISVIAGILCKSGVLRKTGQSQFHPPGKTTCVVIL